MDTIKANYFCFNMRKNKHLAMMAMIATLFIITATKIAISIE